jgi:hypothetical protein
VLASDANCGGASHHFSFDWWLVLISSERITSWLLAAGLLREKITADRWLNNELFIDGVVEQTGLASTRFAKLHGVCRTWMHPVIYKLPRPQTKGPF